MNTRPLIGLSIASALIWTLAACGGSTSPSTPAQTAAGTAFVRLADGSPDIETTSPSLPPQLKCNFGTTAQGFGTLISAEVNGVQATASFPYGAISDYIGVPAAAASISVIYPGGVQSGCPPLTFTTPVLKAGSYQTIAVAGSYQNKTLRFIVFADKAPSDSPGAQMNNASPQFGTTGFGTFVPGKTVFNSAGTVSLGASSPVPTASSAPGLGFYIGPASSPQAALLPSQIYDYDVDNVVPFGNLSHVSLFVIDPPPGASFPNLIGAFY